MVERIESGIPGLDELIQGGFPKGSVTLVSGSAGTGKTIFCCQYLLHGLENGEKGLFVTLEEEPDEIKEDAAEFGWDLGKYQENGEFEIIYLNPFKDFGGFSDRIRSEIEEQGAERVVIDSASVMGMYADKPGDVRERLYNLVRKLRDIGVTTVITSEIPKNQDDNISRYGVEEFVADALVVLYYMGIGAGIYRNIEILKMRKTNQEKGTFPMMIGEQGLRVFHSEEDYTSQQLVKGSIDDVKERVQRDGYDIDQVLEAERKGPNRTTLIDWLEEQKD